MSATFKDLFSRVEGVGRLGEFVPIYDDIDSIAVHHNLLAIRDKKNFFFLIKMKKNKKKNH